MDRKELAARYKKAVEGVLGLVATIDEDGDVIFQHPDRGAYFFKRNAEQDPEYLMVVYPYFMDKSNVGGNGDALVHYKTWTNRQHSSIVFEKHLVEVMKQGRLFDELPLQ
jgi:hypothetical protein